MLQEALQSARRSYQLVPLTAVIVIVFAISIQPTQDLYNRASEQVKTAMAIDWGSYRAWVEARAQPAVEVRRQDMQRWPQVKMYGEQGRDTEHIEEAWKLLESNFHLYRPTVQRRQALRRVVVEMNVSNQVHIRHLMPPQDLGVYDNTTPLDIYRYYHSADAKRNAALLSPNMDAGFQELWNAIGSQIIYQTRYEGPTLVASAVDIAANILINPTGESAGGAGPDVPFQTVVHVKNFRVDWINPQGAVQADAFQTLTTQPNTDTIMDTSIARWLHDEHGGIGMAGGPDNFAPFWGLEYVWREIADRPLIDADLYLNALAAEEKRRGDKVTILGISVPAALVPIAGPLALLLLMVNLNQLLGLAIRYAPQHQGELLAQAWPVLHGRRLWWLDPAITLIALPIAAQWVISLRLTAAEAFWVNSGWFLTAGSVLLAIIACRTLIRLRRVAHEA
jgi:hypothetical protein